MAEPNVEPVLLTMLVLRSHRLEQTKNFYEALGIAFTREQHGSGPVHYSGHLGGTLLELYPLSSELPEENSVRLGFAIEDLESTMDLLRGAGATILSQPEEKAWGYRAVIRDPDGRAVELYQQ